MKKCTLYDGELNDIDINNVVGKVIEMRKESDNDVFLRWNGATMRITKTSTVQEVLDDYDRQTNAMNLLWKKEHNLLFDAETVANKLLKFLASI